MSITVLRDDRFEGERTTLLVQPNTWSSEGGALLTHAVERSNLRGLLKPRELTTIFLAPDEMDALVAWWQAQKDGAHEHS